MVIGLLGPTASAAGQATASQPAGQAERPTSPPQTTPPAVSGVALPADYVIGPDDALGVLYWREPNMSVEQVVVRPDGMITLPLLNEVKAAGFTTEQLRTQVTELAKKFVEEPSITIVVRQINSRKVFITGQVARPGPYPINSPITVLQLITTAGGLLEFAKGKEIKILRNEGGRVQLIKFNYQDVIRGKNLPQNIELKPGDQIVVP
jgi:polysaccharide export outer membrane protein